MSKHLTSKKRFPFYGHDDGLVIEGPDTGFKQTPMTPAQLAAREPALAIAQDIYRFANYAGVCYVELWGIIAKAIQGALDARAADEPSALLLVPCPRCGGTGKLKPYKLEGDTEWRVADCPEKHVTAEPPDAARCHADPIYCTPECRQKTCDHAWDFNHVPPQCAFGCGATREMPDARAVTKDACPHEVKAAESESEQ